MPESRVDRLIREAREWGDFDDLPGLGKPLDPSGLDDPDWWARKKIRDEGLDSTELLPATLQLRRERQEYPESLRDIRDEDAVRRILVDFAGTTGAIAGPEFTHRRAHHRRRGHRRALAGTTALTPRRPGSAVAIDSL